MSQTIRTFRAATSDDALAQVRREMGLDAVIVEVKQVAAGGLFGWLSSRSQFEVRAHRAAPAQTRPKAELPRAVAPNAAMTIAAAAMKSRTTVTVEANAPVESIVLEQKTTTSANNNADLAPPPDLLSDASDLADRLADLVDEVTVTAKVTQPHNRVFPPTTTDAIAPSAPRYSPRISVVETSPASIEQRLDALQQMIAELGRRTSRGLVEIPPELFPHYMSLIEADVEDDVARDLVQQLGRHAAPGQLADTAATMALLTALIERQIPCRHSLTPVTGRRQVAMMVGPTGVGKTTTLAKLAGRFGMQEGCRLGLITVDTYRVAAVEQLRTYAEIIDLPMQIVTTPAEMQAALDSFADCDLVLIDTAGRSPHDDRRLNELKDLIAVAQPDYVYLVLSLASGAGALRSAADRFSAVTPTSVIFTKLDEASGCGGLLSATRDIGLPVAYFTTGQEVPRDIEPANPCRAARLIVGLETVNRSSH